MSDIQRLRIMVVEDEPDISLIISELLRPHYDVVIANNGLEALDRLARYEPDLTIMDLMMPVLDGFDTTRAIKKDTTYASMPVLFLTARRDNQAVREALMAGGDMYMEKPFDPPELFGRIREMVEKNRVVPRTKNYTVAQIQEHYKQAASSESIERPVAFTAGRPLTEQLARAAGEPRPRVLLVMNSPDLLKAYHRILHRKFEVINLRDPEQAPEKIIAYQPDILVLDSSMATLSGIHLALLTKLNHRLRVPHLVMIVDSDEARSRALASGAKVVRKPLSDEALEGCLQEIVSSQEFALQKKRVNFREILRREDPSDSEI
jgi:DNA-binding response OmpR family regulator